MRKGLKTLEEEIHEEVNDIEEEFSFDVLPEMNKYESIQLRQLESNPPQIVPQNSNVSFNIKDNTLEGINSQKSYVSTILQKEPSKFSRLNRNQSLVNPYERDFGSFDDLIKGQENNDEDESDDVAAIQDNNAAEGNYEKNDEDAGDMEFEEGYKNDEMKEIQMRGKFAAFEESRHEYDIDESDSEKVDLDNRSESEKNESKESNKVDDRDLEIEKLSKGEETKALQSLDEWVQVSKNNLKLRLMLRQTRGEQLREKAISKKQTSAWVLIHDRTKRKMKKILQQQANLVDFCKETKQMYEGAVDAMKKTTTKLAQSQEKFMKVNKELSESQAKELVIRNSLIAKESELNEVKDELRVLKEEMNRLREKQSGKDKAIIQNDVEMQGADDENENEKKDQKQQDTKEFEEFAKLLTGALMEKEKLQELAQSKDQQIQKLTNDLIAACEWQSKYRCTEDELQLIKNNNKQLVIQINNKQAQIEQYQLDSLRTAQINKDNQELKNSVNLLSQQLMQKHTLMIEQEVMHSVALKQAQLKQTPLHEPHLREKLQNFIEVESINSPDNHEDNDMKLATKQRNLIKQLFGWDLMLLDGIEEEEHQAKLVAVNSKSASTKPFTLDIFLPDNQITNRQELLENADSLIQMIVQQPQVMTALASCTENFWLLAALLLKQYLDQSTSQEENEGEEDEEEQDNEENSAVQGEESEEEAGKDEGEEQGGEMFQEEEEDDIE